MSKIKIIDSAYASDIKVGDIVINDNHLFIVIYTTNKTFNGIVLGSDRFEVGSIRYEMNKVDYRDFKGTIIVE